jgi:hypothetical protein
MGTFASTDEQQMRRCRYAQLRRLRVKETFGDVWTTGYVQAIRPFNPTATRWNITVVEDPPRQPAKVIPLLHDL